MKQLMKCPICGKVFTDPPALSRKDNKTQICPECGIDEALEAFYEADGRSTEELKKAKAEIHKMIADKAENAAGAVADKAQDAAEEGGNILTNAINKIKNLF